MRLPRVAALQPLQGLNKKAVPELQPSRGGLVVGESGGTPARPRRINGAATAHKFEALGRGEPARRPMYNEVLPLAQHTCSFAPRLFWNAQMLPLAPGRENC